MKRVIAGAAVLLLLTGCSRPASETAPASEPELAQQIDCTDVSAGALAGIQWGLDQRQDGLTATEAVVLKNPASDLSWFVAASIEGPGMGSDSVGVWSTITDPATAPDTIAYTSVDAIAKEFSVYVQPDGYSSALEGVDEVRSCIE